MLLARVIMKLFGGLWNVKKICQSSGASPIVRFLHHLYTWFLDCRGSYIGITAEFAGEPVFPHGITGVFIAGGARIGRNAVIFQHVTIGSNSIPDSRGKGAPIIGDNCYIGAGAKIIGGVTIGDNVRIGANCVVTTDVPTNSVVVLQPPRIIHKEKLLDNRFYSFRGGQWKFYHDGGWHTVTDGEVLSTLQGL